MSRLVGPQPSTPADSGVTGPGVTSPGPRTIPEDLLREASRRLGALALLGAVLWLVAPVLEHFAIRLLTMGDPRWLRLGFPDLVSLLNCIVSFLLYRYTRVSTREPQFMLDLGLAYLIFTSLSISTIWHWDIPNQGYQVQPMLTWVGVLVIMFAAMIPNPPRKTLLVGFIAVSMMPIEMLIARARGWDFGAISKVWVMHYPDYMLLGVAWVIANAVTRMGQQVGRARELGSYHIGELLGRGGMGEVYRATHRMLARPAAIKLIRPEILAGTAESTQLATTRFKREAEVAASLQSPHTVVLYDFGVTDEGALYLVMEMLEGLDLEHLVRRFGSMSAGRTVHILRQVCDSLEEAHVRGLVHRDIKPANIHVGRVGLHHDFVKVLDFGLAKPTHTARADAPGATADGILPGTPDYMAPEMTLGRAVDGRADLYAVGCVAYYLLTGRQVFEANNVFHMISRHLNDIPVPPSQLATQPIPAELERLVLACLAKAPEERPQTAGELSRLLGQVPADDWNEAVAKAWWMEYGAIPNWGSGSSASGGGGNT